MCVRGHKTLHTCKSDVHKSPWTHTDTHTLTHTGRKQKPEITSYAWTGNYSCEQVWPLPVHCTCFSTSSKPKLGEHLEIVINKIRPKSGLSQLWPHLVRKSMRTSQATADALIYSTHVLPRVFAGGVIWLVYRDLFTIWPRLNANQHQREEVCLVCHTPSDPSPSLNQRIETMDYMYVVVVHACICTCTYICVWSRWLCFLSS